MRQGSKRTGVDHLYGVGHSYSMRVFRIADVETFILTLRITPQECADSLKLSDPTVQTIRVKLPPIEFPSVATITISISCETVSHFTFF